MNQIASPSQLRMSFLRWALFTVPVIMLLGRLSGVISGSGADNRWYAELVKPELQPPGWVFATVWPTLYLMMGIAFAMILHARGARGRGRAIGLFLLQFFLNLCWSPLFFGSHKVGAAFYLLLAILLLAAATMASFGRIRRAAGLLMLPYILWLCFAAYLNFQVDRLNPGAEGLHVPAASTQIGHG